MRKLLLSALLFCFSTLGYATEPLTLEWPDLIPEQERDQFNSQGMPLINHDGGQMMQNLTGGVRQELSGSMVKIPGFVIPLEGDDKVITEFLLVPYFGACIHVPPPPPNQIVYVKFPDGAPVQMLWDVIYVVGKLTTTTMEHELAQTGYLLEGIAIEDYVDPTISEEIDAWADE